MPDERPNGTKIALIDGQNCVRSKLGGERNIDGIGQIEVEVEVLGPDGLGDVEDVDGDFGKDGPAGAGPPSDVVDGLVRGVATEDATGHVIELGEEHRRNDDRAGVTQYGPSGFTIGMISIERGDQAGGVGDDDDQRARCFVCR